jgi:hypothetical protein
MFPILEASEIERVRRFGVVRSFNDGEALEQVGVVGDGLIIIPGWRGRGQPARPIRTPNAYRGAFLGELAQLAGRPALIDAYARGAVHALVISPGRLRALLIAEAELGERIMRALAPCRSPRIRHRRSGHGDGGCCFRFSSSSHIASIRASLAEFGICQRARRAISRMGDH